MPGLVSPPPESKIAGVTEVLHGISVTDPYRWLEDQNSAETRSWLRAQSDYARSYLDSIPGREQVQKRVRELLTVETRDSLLIASDLYIFRKGLPNQEQPCIYVCSGPLGDDQLLLDPATLGRGEYISVKPVTVSWNGQLLLYEVKCGGERSGTFELLDIPTRQVLPDKLPRGYLRGFAFSPDSKAFYYVHESEAEPDPNGRVVYCHVLGDRFEDDRVIFRSEVADDVRLQLIPGKQTIGIVVRRFREKTYTDFYLFSLAKGGAPELWLEDVDYRFIPLIHNSGRLLALTDRDAPNLQVLEPRRSDTGVISFEPLVPENDSPIKGWAVTRNLICVLYQHETKTNIDLFNLNGRRLRSVPIHEEETVRLIAAARDNDEFFLERESFASPIRIERYAFDDEAPTVWAKRQLPFKSVDLHHIQVWYPAKDGIQIPMFLAGRREVLESSLRPIVMTSYGGYGVSMTPQFSVFTTFLMERGCIFALPNIRGGSEFGAEWYLAAKRRRRQTAFDDFLGAAEWLIKTGRAGPKRLAIFGGSNSGLLVAAAMTQRPDLFRAVVCMVPLLDMLRYHLFDGAHRWKDEFGTAEDPADFAALAAYSPYHNVRDNTAYPATMIVSGDADQNCNPMHARKMAARLQAANASPHPMILEYQEFRGHSPVLPLSARITGLSDRLAFLCDQLGLTA